MKKGLSQKYKLNLNDSKTIGGKGNKAGIIKKKKYKKKKKNKDWWMEYVLKMRTDCCLIFCLTDRGINELVGWL